MITGSSCNQSIAPFDQLRGHSLGVCKDLSLVLLKFCCIYCLQVCCDSANLLVVWTSLETRENCVVNFLRQVTRIFSWKNYAGSGTLQWLVSCCHDNVGVLKRSVLEPRCYKTTNMADISEKICADAITYLSEAIVLNFPWVCRRSCNNKFGLKLLSIAHQSFIVNQSGLLVATVLLRLPKKRGCRHLARWGEKTVRQMASFSQHHTHQTLARRNQSCVNSEVRRTARKSLNIAPPLVFVKTICRERTSLR